MNKEHYNQIIDWTVQQEQLEDKRNTLEAARLIFKNMGIPLPNGTMEEAVTVLATNDYMGWRKCTAKEAQTCANDGTAAMAVKGNEIYIVKAESDGKDKAATVHFADGNTVSIPSQLAGQEDVQFYSYSAATTVAPKSLVTVLPEEGGYNKVYFHESKKTWYCINHDMIYDDTYSGNTYLIERTNKNYWVDIKTSRDVRTYSITELRLLYAIDPYGVANYVKRYAENKYGSRTLEDTLHYKDWVFRFLFAREPKYFARNEYGHWVETTDTCDLSAVLSESEAYFGMHAIWDDITRDEIRGLAFNILGLVVNAVLGHFLIFKSIKNVVSYGEIIFSCGIAFLKSELAYIGKTALETAIGETKLSWAATIVNVVGDIYDIVSSLSPEKGYTKQIIDYCAGDLPYDIYMKTINGQTYWLQDISNALA